MLMHRYQCVCISVRVFVRSQTQTHEHFQAHTGKLMKMGQHIIAQVDTDEILDELALSDIESVTKLHPMHATISEKTNKYACLI